MERSVSSASVTVPGRNAEQSGARPRVVVVGGGMGGLATALALKSSGADVLVIERDPEPLEIEPDAAFDSWNHPGVPQLRHTHIFLARLQTILRDHHPEFLAELEKVGIERASLDEVLPPGVAASYVPSKSDDDFLHLWGRRATFEYALRRHVRGLGHVRFLHDARVEGLVTEREGRHLRVRGVDVRRSGTGETIAADIVVDASGVRSKIPDMLRATGADIRIERTESPCAYYCRHYAQRDARVNVPRSGTGAHVDYLVFGTFFAEKGTFSIAFACPEFEDELCDALRRPDGFDGVCRQIPVLARLIGGAEPISRVMGGAGLANRWTSYSRRGSSEILGLFPVGDCHVVTNPIYGRGCSMAFVQAHALAETLEKTADPLARARRYHRRVRELLRPHFDFCVAADRGFAVRARMARGEPVSLFDRLISKAYEKVLAPALEERPLVSREWLRAQQMREVSPPRVALMVLLYTLYLWALRVLRGTRRPPRTDAPSRADMLRAVATFAPHPAPASSSPHPSSPRPSLLPSTPLPPPLLPPPTLPSSIPPSPLPSSIPPSSLASSSSSFPPPSTPSSDPPPPFSIPVSADVPNLADYGTTGRSGPDS